MPTSSELIQAQREFEIPRGLHTHNTYGHSLFRIQEEWLEAVDALMNETPHDLMMETIDIVIFCHSLLGNLAEGLGIEPADIDRLIETKVLVNHRKYDEEFFHSRSTADAIVCARHWWNLGLADEQLGNDYY